MISIFEPVFLNIPDKMHGTEDLYLYYLPNLTTVQHLMNSQTIPKFS